jgi:hypothetical protein
MNSELIAERLRTLQPAARTATNYDAVSEVISNLADIFPLDPRPRNPRSGPFAVLAVLPLLQSLLPGLKSIRVESGDESVDFGWEAEIELEDGFRYGEGKCAAGAILCAAIEVLSAIEPSQAQAKVYLCDPALVRRKA